MVTKENFKTLVQTIRPEELQLELDKHHDYVLFEAHIFNVGGFATITSMDYDQDVAEEAGDSGQLFCDKDDFQRLLWETQALEY